MIGKNAGKCLYNQRKYFKKIVGKASGKTDPALQKTVICDLVSELQENALEKSVKEEHRLKSLQRRFSQRYMNTGWKDYEFIRELKTNKVLLKSNQNSESFNIINREIDDCVEKTGNLIVIDKSVSLAVIVRIILNGSTAREKKIH